MATKTTNYGLTKPSGNDDADISVINANMDIIDTKMKEIEDAGGGGGGGSASAWSDISDKPFESIGNGLEVDENGVMSATGCTVDAYTKAQTDNLLSNKVDNGIISDEYNSATTYEVGQYCIYNNSLWKCILQHNGQTPEEGTYWTKTQIDDEILSIKNDISTLNSNLEYVYLTQLVGFSSDNLSLFYAYKENGIITLNLNIPHGITGVFSAKINSVYAPRNITYGIASYGSSSNDVNKISSASITTDGTINVWIAQALDANETVQFSYPMKRS